MDLAKTLVRTIARGFYTTDYVLIIDALAIHSTLTDADLAHVLGMQTKALRRLCGKLKEDGLISVQSRGEKKEGAPPAYFGYQQNGRDQPKERLFFRDWYYINFHRAIDSIKYRMWKLNRHIESRGAPTTERKDLSCPRCKSAYTELEVIDNVGDEGFYCQRCGHLLDYVADDDFPAENEYMKRMNDQLAKILALMRQIDSAPVPENDFDAALAAHLPIDRPDSNPGARTTIVDEHKPQIASSKGLAVAPEKVSVNLTESKGEADSAAQAAARAERREREAAQNALPEWISRSTLTGEMTAVGAREQADRARREAEGGPHQDAPDAGGDGEDRKGDVLDKAVMDEYWAELKAAQERERREDEEGSEEEEDDEEDEDDFEDVEGVGEHVAKKVKIEEPEAKAGEVKEEKVSDADDDDDDDELEFEDV